MRCFSSSCSLSPWHITMPNLDLSWTLVNSHHKYTILWSRGPFWEELKVLCNSSSFYFSRWERKQRPHLSTPFLSKCCVLSSRDRSPRWRLLSWALMSRWEVFTAYPRRPHWVLKFTSSLHMSQLFNVLASSSSLLLCSPLTLPNLSVFIWTSVQNKRWGELGTGATESDVFVYVLMYMMLVPKDTFLELCLQNDFDIQPLFSSKQIHVWGGFSLLGIW